MAALSDLSISDRSILMDSPPRLPRDLDPFSTPPKRFSDLSFNSPTSPAKKPRTDCPESPTTPVKATRDRVARASSLAFYEVSPPRMGSLPIAKLPPKAPRKGMSFADLELQAMGKPDTFRKRVIAFHGEANWEGIYPDVSQWHADLGKFLGEGEYSRCYQSLSNPNQVIKTFKQNTIITLHSHIDGYFENKNNQYNWMNSLGIPWAETEVLPFGWRQEKLPHLLETHWKSLDLGPDTKIMVDEMGILRGEIDETSAEILRQMKEIYRICWENGAEIDPLLQNFGFTYVNGNLIVKGFDTREEQGDSLQVHLPQAIKQLSRNNPTIRDYLAPQGYINIPC